MAVVHEYEESVLSVFVNDAGSITIKDVVATYESTLFGDREPVLITVSPKDIPALISLLRQAADEVREKSCRAG